MSVQYTTPFSQLLDDGTYELRFPQQVIVGSSLYNFTSWSDGASIVIDSGTSEVVRTLILSANRTLGATYSLATFTLRITSSPITGIPVTVDDSQYTTSQTLTLTQGSHSLVAPPNVTSGSSVYNFLSWEDGSTNPSRTLNLASDMTVTLTYHLQVVSLGAIEIHAFLDEAEIVAPFVVVGVGTGTTPSTVQDVGLGTYTINVTYGGQTLTQSVSVALSQTYRLDFQFTTTIKPKPNYLSIILGAGAMLGTVIYAGVSNKKK